MQQWKRLNPSNWFDRMLLERRVRNTSQLCKTRHVESQEASSKEIQDQRVLA